MSPVVSDTGPLLALAGINQLVLLRELFGHVLVAPEVRMEVEAGGLGRPGADLFATAPWITVAASGIPDPLLESLLDRGEAATIALAVHVSAPLVLMDEAKGRRIAREMHCLEVAGTGRILVEAKRVGLLREVREPILAMRENGYWLSDRIVAEILHRAEE